MTKVLITGGSGFIGTNLVQACVNRGDEVLNLDRAAPRDPALHPSWLQADICDPRAVAAALRAFSPDYVVHLAARTDLDGKTLREYDANIGGVRNLIHALRQAPPRRVIFASSMFVCRLGYIPQRPDEYCPHTVYGESKVAGEKLVRELAGDCLSWIIVRPTSIWGPWFDVPYKGFFTAVRSGMYFHPRGRVVRRSYGFVLNIVAQILKLISPEVPDSALQGRMFYLADYEPTDIKRWADLIAEAFGVGRTHELPIPILRTGAVCGDVLKKVGWKNPPLTSFRLSNLLTEAVFDTSDLRLLCGSSPFSLQEAVKITVEWMRQQDKIQRAHDQESSVAASPTS